MESRASIYTDWIYNKYSIPIDHDLKVLILGKGKTGISLSNFFEKHNIYYEIVTDNSDDSSFKRLKEELPLFDLCITSPGIRINSEIYILAKMLSRVVTSELSFSLSFLKNNTSIIITGSNGKTSLCILLKKVLSKYIKTHLYGNIGEPLINHISEIKKDEIVILEASSFQLENYDCQVDIGVIKNYQENHLDKVLSKEIYFASKKRLGLYANKMLYGENILANSNDYRVDEDYIYINNKKYIDRKQLKRNDATFIEDIFIVLNILSDLKMNFSLAKSVFYDFGHVPFRYEKYKTKKSIVYINDGKSSSSSSTKYAYSLTSDRTILIIGGIHKSSPFDLKIKKGDKVYIYGKDRYLIKEELKQGIIKETLNEVLKSLKNEKNCTILFSPGCASFDQYNNYQERSLEFKKWVDNG